MTANSKKCPICGKPRNADFRPFCSARCKDRDLAKWFGDGYAVPGPAVNPEDFAEDIGRED
ncbi:DNA gyrase inhibitor YacG [Alteraurantiacibacter aestuarii]|uniref:DNA gyrase inhibitor YacG n=1 Tax=Alteraurantiacibacter aestuarii TaxID=650004 RepID=UPI0031DF14F5